MNCIKKIVFIMITGFLFVNCKHAVKENKAATASETTAKEEGSITVTGKTEMTSFTIEGMSCAVMCAAKIEKDLAGQEGVQNAKVDFDTKTATVKYDPIKQTPEKLAKTVEALAGGKLYKVSDIK